MRSLKNRPKEPGGGIPSVFASLEAVAVAGSEQNQRALGGNGRLHCTWPRWSTRKERSEVMVVGLPRPWLPAKTVVTSETQI